MTTPHDEHLVPGMEGAREAIKAIAEGNEPAALAVLNSLEHAAVTVAAAYLLSALKESAAVYAAHHNRRRKRGDRFVTARSLLLRGIDEDAFVEDVLMTRVGQALDDATRGEGIG